MAGSFTTKKLWSNKDNAYDTNHDVQPRGVQDLLGSAKKHGLLDSAQKPARKDVECQRPSLASAA